MWIERMVRWSVVFLAWILSFYSLIQHTAPEWSVFHLLALTALLWVTELFPFPEHGGRVTVHFPFLFALGSLYSPGVAGIVYGLTVLFVGWMTKKSLSNSAFRSGYTILGLMAAEAYISFMRQPLLEAGDIWKLLLVLAVYVLVFELVSKIIRDGTECLRLRPRYSRLWVNNWLWETGIALLSLLYCAAFFGMLWQERDTDTLAFIFFFTPLVAFAVLSNVIARLMRKRRKLELLFLLSTNINKTLNLREVMEQTILPLSKVIDYSYGIFYLLKNERLYPSVTSGDVPHHLKKQSHTLNRGLNGWVASHGQPAMVDDVKLDPRCHEDLEDAEEVRSMLCVPLEMDGEVLGVITLGKADRRGFEEADLTFLQVLASQTVIALHNARLMNERERRVVAEERNRLAREIHDGIAQSFAGVLMKVESSLKVFDSQPEQVRSWLEQSEKKLREGLKEVRHSITALRPSPAAKIGLIPALRRRVEAFQNETDVDAFFEQEGENYPLSTEAEETVYMVCHEALSNAAKHAKASEVKVTLRYEPEELKLVVEDNGVGFSLAQAVYKAEAQKRYGIVGMNERAQNLNAALQFDSEEGQGARVILTIPMKEEAIQASSGQRGKNSTV
ncbi:GAF domain-containing sensor histidine kinase [Paludifilum halophilum]|nr:GAF domain-containing sensor histidine kinase [Paludifilum halophilum]